MKKKIVIIGGGIGGLASAMLLGKKGYDVTLLEKNKHLGGRANIFTEQGFTFDMGPSWYMMPDIFEDFFKLVGEDITKYLTLERLAPSYRVFLESEHKHYDFYSDMEKNLATFESLEPGSGEKLKEHLKRGGFQYKISKQEFMYKNYDSIFDFVNKRVMTEGRKLPLFSSMSTIVNKLFSNELLQKVLQYQTVLLGTSPYNTPGIYSLMNYVDFVDGIWYPKGGIYELIKALVTIAKKNNVTMRTEVPVSNILIVDGVAKGVRLESGEEITADIVISNADYEHTETKLMDEKYREHSTQYWESRTLAPSAFIMYLGVDGLAPSLTHHNLLFSADWNKNFAQIFDTPQWPDSPSIYVCKPSETDPTVAPHGTENLFVLVPIASGLPYTEVQMKEYGDKVLSIMERVMEVPDLTKRIIYRRDYCVKDFERDYNSYKGTALGPAHTLMQTAFFRPNNISKKVKNLYYVGAYTNPGIGMPVCMISAQLVYKRIEGIKDPSPLTEL